VSRGTPSKVKKRVSRALGGRFSLAKGGKKTLQLQRKKVIFFPFFDFTLSFFSSSLSSFFCPKPIERAFHGGKGRGSPASERPPPRLGRPRSSSRSRGQRIAAVESEPSAKREPCINLRKKASLAFSTSSSRPLFLSLNFSSSSSFSSPPLSHKDGFRRHERRRRSRLRLRHSR